MKKLFLFIFLFLAVFLGFSFGSKAQIISFDDYQFTSLWQFEPGELMYQGLALDEHSNWNSSSQYPNYPNLVLPFTESNGYYGKTATFFIDKQAIWDRYYQAYATGYELDLDDYSIISLQLRWVFALGDLIPEGFECNLPYTFRNTTLAGYTVKELVIEFDEDFFDSDPEIVTLSYWYEGQTMTGFNVFLPKLLISFSDYEEVVPEIPVVDQYDDLPLLDEGDFRLLSSVELVDVNNGVYRFGLNLFPYSYTFDVVLPGVVTDHEFTYLNFSYGSSADGDRLLYFTPNHLNNPYPDGYFDEDLICINLSEMTFAEFYRLSTVGFIQKESNNVGALYMFLPDSIDQLMSVDLSFNYRLKNLFTGYGDWETVRNVYYAYEDDSEFFGYNMAEINPPRWSFWLSSTVYLFLDLINSYDQQEITKMTSGELPDAVKTLYFDELEGSVYDLEDFSYYRIVLGQFRSGLSIGFDIEDVIIISLTYLKDGDLITVPQSHIDQLISDYVETNHSLPEIFDDLPAVFSGAGSFLSLALGLGLVGVVLVGVLWLNRKLKEKEYRKR